MVVNKGKFSSRVFGLCGQWVGGGSGKRNPYSSQVSGLTKDLTVFDPIPCFQSYCFLICRKGHCTSLRTGVHNSRKKWLFSLIERSSYVYHTYTAHSQKSPNKYSNKCMMYGTKKRYFPESLGKTAHLECSQSPPSTAQPQYFSPQNLRYSRVLTPFSYREL